MPDVRRQTTAEWAASTVPLEKDVWGVEINTAGIAIDTRLGTGKHLWPDLPVPESPAGVGPYVGWMTRPPWSSTANTAPVDQRATMYPVDVVADTYDALGAQVATAQVAGTVSLTLGIYPSTPDGLPDTTTLLGSGTIAALTATGNVWATFAAPLVLATRRYWVASLYVVTSAPTTIPLLICLNGITYALPVPATSSINAAIRALCRAGVTTLPTTATTAANVAVSGSADVPLLGLRRSA